MFNQCYRGKRVFVTGHTGFKGAWLCQWLLNLGAEVCGYSLYVPSQPSLFETLLLQRHLQDIRADIRDLSALSTAIQTFKPDMIFHLAAQPLVLHALSDPKTTFDTNAGGTVNMLEAMLKSASVEAAVFVTSDKCYENVEWEFGYRETDRLGGKDPYSASKACAEMIISAYQRSFLINTDKKIASARAGNVIGGGDWAANRIIPDAVMAWSSGAAVTVRHPSATRPWQHVLEPLSGYLCLGAHLMGNSAFIAGEAFNFGPKVEYHYTVKQLMTALAKAWGPSAKMLFLDSLHQTQEAGLLKLCCDKALQRLDWQSTLDFNTLVEMVATWYRGFYQGSCDMEVLTQKQIQHYENSARHYQRAWAETACMAMS